MTGIDFTAWTDATADLPWGVQRTFMDALSAVAENGTHMVFGVDYDSAAMPCLVNTAAPMLVTGGGQGVPSRSYPKVVSAFDDINSRFRNLGINEGNRVSPLAADFLLRNFGDLKPAPTEADLIAAIKIAEVPVVQYAPEITDEEFNQHLLTMGAEAPTAESVTQDSD